jgi:hypothetical protein
MQRLYYIFSNHLFLVLMLGLLRFTDIEKPIVVSHAVGVFKKVLEDGQSFALECLDEHQLDEQYDYSICSAPANIGIKNCFRATVEIALSHTELTVEKGIIRGAAKLPYSCGRVIYILSNNYHTSYSLIHAQTDFPEKR